MADDRLVWKVGFNGGCLEFFRYAVTTEPSCTTNNAGCSGSDLADGHGDDQQTIQVNPAMQKPQLQVNSSGPARTKDSIMATDIVSAVSRFLTPELLGKLATASGLDSTTARTAITAAVPSILSGLAGMAGTPGGARQLATAVKDQPVDILGSILSGFSGSSQMAQQGTGLLSSLLGGGPLGLLTSAVSKFSGVGEGSIRSLMGLLTPVIMGVLGREQRAAGLDMNGLARMLTGQKEQIAAAIPPGLSELLDASGFQECMASTPERRTYDSPRAAYDAPRTAHMQRAVAEPTGTKRGVTWPYWVLPLLALGGLLWAMLPSDRQSRRAANHRTRSHLPACHPVE